MKNAVALLGFNLELSDEEEHARFWAMLNTVLPMVAQYAPIERRLTLVHQPPQPSTVISVIDKPYADAVTIIAPSAAALYFEVTGSGRAVLSLREQTYELSWENVVTPVAKRLIVKNVLYGEGDVSISFEGAYAYRVLNFCAYDTLTSGDAADILPPSSVVCYDMTQLVEDFLEFLPAPVSVQGLPGVAPPRYRLCGRTVIEVARCHPAVLEIRYRPRVKQVSEENENEQLDVEPTLHHLVPLLLAHYLWMDDEPSKAAQYKANYDEQLALWRMRSQATAHPFVHNDMGW